MNSQTAPTHNPIPAPYPPKDYFDYKLPVFGDLPGATDRNYWIDYCKSFFYAGTTLYLWNEAPELKVAFLAACDIQTKQQVLLISKYGEESGLVPALKSLMGKGSSLSVEEIGTQAVDALSELQNTTGKKLQWNFNYLDSVPDSSLDRVIIFGAASHVGNWEGFAQQIDRVIRNGGKVIIAEAPLGGKEFHNAMHIDSHLEGLIGKVISGMGIEEEELPDITTKDLTALFKPYLGWCRAFSWEGLYLFYGQKGDKEGVAQFKLPKQTREVHAFLSVRPSKNSWDFLAEPEKAVWGDKVSKIVHKEENWGADLPFEEWGRDVAFGGGNLIWMWHNNRTITDMMWSNLMVSPGDKVFMIAELSGPFGVSDEVRKRVGQKGEVVDMDMTEEGGCNFKGWQEKRKKYIEQGFGEEWPYDFVDDYPDNYFDLIFLPQGVHHCNNWLRDAPRLLRALKPGHQIMAIECGLYRPEFVAGREKSALARLIIDRVFEFMFPPWWNMVEAGEKPYLEIAPASGHEGRTYHDVSTSHLREAFGDSLYDVNSIEWKGWILFWGYKK